MTISVSWNHEYTLTIDGKTVSWAFNPDFCAGDPSITELITAGSEAYKPASGCRGMLLPEWRAW